MNEKIELKGRCAMHPPLAVETFVHHAVARLVNSFLSQPELTMDAFLRSWRSHRMDVLRSRCPSRYHPSQYVQLVYSVCLNSLFAEAPDAEKDGLLGGLSSPDARMCLVNCCLLMALYLFFLFGREPVRIDQAAVLDIRAALELTDDVLAPESGEFCGQVRQAIGWMMRCGAFVLCTRTGPVFACPQCSLPRQRTIHRRSQSGLQRTLLLSAGYLLQPSCPMAEETSHLALESSAVDRPPPSDGRAWTKEGDVAQRREQVLRLRRQRRAEEAARCQRRMRRLLAKVYRSKRALEDAQGSGGGISGQWSSNAQIAQDTRSTPSVRPANGVHDLLLELETQVQQIAQDYNLSLDDMASVAEDSDSSDSEETVDSRLLNVRETTYLPSSHDAGGLLDEESLSPLDLVEPDSSAVTDRDLAEANHLLIDLEQQVHEILGTALRAIGSQSKTTKRPRRQTATPQPRRPKAVRPDSETAPKKPRASAQRRPRQSPDSGIEALLGDLETTASHILSQGSARGRE